MTLVANSPAIPSGLQDDPFGPVCWYSGSTNTVSKCREIRIDRQRLNSPPVSLLSLDQELSQGFCQISEQLAESALSG
jgi:hypothetical protein